jgi:phage tail sheath protein FI
MTDTERRRWEFAQATYQCLMLNDALKQLWQEFMRKVLDTSIWDRADEWRDIDGWPLI